MVSRSCVPSTLEAEGRRIVRLKLAWAVELDCYQRPLEIYFIYYVYNSVCLDSRVVSTCAHCEVCCSELRCTDSGSP